MRVAPHSIGLRSSLAILIVTALTTRCSATEKILHNFNQNGRDGTNPIAGLMFGQEMTRLLA